MPSELSIIIEWIRENEVVIGWLGSLSLLLLLGFFIAGPLIIVKLPSDYFQRYIKSEVKEDTRTSLPHLFFLIFKNIFGAVFLLAGLAMLFLPGQGLITLIIGLSLLSLPGKRRLLVKILCGQNVLKTMNRLRSKFNQPPLRI